VRCVAEFLKILEENPLHVIIAYKNSLPDSAQQAIFNSINLETVKLRKRRVVLHVFSDKPTPLSLEDLRSILLNNVHLTITTRLYELSREALANTLSKLKSSGGSVLVFVTRDLGEYADLLNGLNYVILEGW